MTEFQVRARNAMIGLAIGDALSWSSLFHRSFLLPQWTRRIRREIEIDSENKNVITYPLPFSLNQDPAHFDISPTDDTEWAAFTAEILINSDGISYQKKAYEEWTKIADSNEKIRGSVGVMASLTNLKKSIQPPQSGRENPHYFDDSAMPRAVPIGIVYAGQPDRAALLAEIDASITNYEDGIWAAKALAAAISTACSGAKIYDVIETALAYLPKSSWVRRSVEDAFLIIKGTDSIFSSIPELQKEIVNREYSYGNAAPETIALLLSILQLHSTNFEFAVTSAASFSKNSETLPAAVGALAGAMQSKKIQDESWLNSISVLKGICIPSLLGKNYLLLIEQLINKANTPK